MREDVFSAPAQPAWLIARIIERLYGDLPDAQRVDRSLRTGSMSSSASHCTERPGMTEARTM